MEALVKNASDPKQVKRAETKERLNRRQELDDLRAVLKTREGRRFIWRLLERCRAFASVWDPGAKIHYNAGQQDIGHFLFGEIAEANEEALLQMMKESKEGALRNG